MLTVTRTEETLVTEDAGGPEPSGDNPAGSSAGGDTSAELERVRAERDAARAELERLRGRPSRHVVRRVAAGVLVAISCLSFLTGAVGIWAQRSLLDTDVWVDHVGPLAEDPDVQAALSAKITDEVMELVDPQALFEEVLPERGQLLAVPLSGAVQGFVGDRVESFVASDTFAELWVGINERAHAAAVRVLRGDAPAVETSDDSVTLNLVPVINQVLAQVTSASPEIFGRTVDIPDVQIDEIPTAAIDKINSAFGTDLPDDFGQITIYDQGKLKEVQDAIALFDKIVWISVVLFVVSTIGALAVSVNRRHTLLALSIVDVLILILMRRGTMAAQDQILSLVRVEENVPAATAVTDALTQGLFDASRILLWFFAIVIVVTWVSGPTPRARSLRRWTASSATTLAGTARERGADPATAAWLVAHRDALRVAGVVVAVVLLWTLSLSWLWVFVLLGVLAAYEAALTRLEAPEDADSDQAAPGQGTGGDTPAPTAT